MSCAADCARLTAASAAPAAAGPIGWCVGLMSAGLAAANLLVDYQVMQDGARQRLPQWFEW